MCFAARPSHLPCLALPALPYPTSRVPLPTSVPVHVNQFPHLHCTVVCISTSSLLADVTRDAGCRAFLTLHLVMNFHSVRNVFNVMDMNDEYSPLCSLSSLSMISYASLAAKEREVRLRVGMGIGTKADEELEQLAPDDAYLSCE